MAFQQIKLSHISLKALEINHVYSYPIYYRKENGSYTVLVAKDSKFSQNITDKIMYFSY